MKIKVKDLKPNPYRNMKEYPIDREKVEALKNSIKETSFWDNLLVRKQNGEYQIAYGHHRLFALQELKIKEVDVPVKDLDNATMLRIMANENMDYWDDNPEVIIETVKATRDYLNAELAKYESWEALNKNIKRLIDKFNFNKVKQQGVGQTTILKFLGGNWRQYQIQNALNSIDKGEIGEYEAKKLGFRTTGTYRKALKDVEETTGKKIPIEKRKEAVDKVKKRIDSLPKGKNKGAKLSEGGYSDTMKSVVKQELFEDTTEKEKQDNPIELELNNQVIIIEKVNKELDRLTGTLAGVNQKFNDLGIESLKNTSLSFLSISSYISFIKQAKSLFKKFEIELNIDNDEK